jgi:hypothetical protein
MSGILYLLAVLLLPVAVNAASVDQPSFPKPNQFDWQSLDTKCGQTMIFTYPANIQMILSVQSVRAVYIEDDKKNPIEVRHFWRDGRQTIWIDRNRDGWFDEKFYDPISFLKKYSTLCHALIIRK